MVFKVKPKAATAAAVIKDGTYRATVSNLKQFANTYGERIGFEFTIKGGQFDGERVMRSTAPQLSKQSKLREAIESVIDVAEFNAQVEQEAQDSAHIQAHRKVVFEAINGRAAN